MFRCTFVFVLFPKSVDISLAYINTQLGLHKQFWSDFGSWTWKNGRFWSYSCDFSRRLSSGIFCDLVDLVDISNHQGSTFQLWANINQLQAPVLGPTDVKSEEWLSVRDGGMLRTRKMGDLGDWTEERFLDDLPKQPAVEISMMLQVQPSLCRHDNNMVKNPEILRHFEAEEFRPWMFLLKF